MLLEMLAKRKGPKVEVEEVEIETTPNEEEDENTATDLAPKGEMQSAEEDLEMGEVDPMADETHEDKEQDMELLEEMMGGMKPEQMGDKPKSLRERAIIEMMKQRKG